MVVRHFIRYSAPHGLQADMGGVRSNCRTEIYPEVMVAIRAILLRLSLVIVRPYRGLVSQVNNLSSSHGVYFLND
jgi:hypothetical protein